MLVRAWATVVFLISVLTGCAEPRAFPRESLLLFPSDLSTGIADEESLLGAHISTSFRAPEYGQLALDYSEAEREALTRAIHVRRVRDGAEAPGASSFVDAGILEVDVAFHPSSPMTRGWYQMELDTSGLRRPYALGDLRRPALGAAFYPGDPFTGSSLTTHFFVGSLPLLSVQISNDGDQDLFIEADEPLRLADASVDLLSLVTVRSAETTLDCSMVDGWVSLEAGSFRVRCGAYDTAVPLTVTVRPGLVSLEGVPLRDHLGRAVASVTWTPDETTSRFAPRSFSDALLALE